MVTIQQQFGLSLCVLGYMLFTKSSHPSDAEKSAITHKLSSNPWLKISERAFLGKDMDLLWL